MTELTIYPDKIENFLRAIIPAVEAGIWQPYHAVLMDPPYYLGEIVDRFGGATAAPAKPGTDGSFSRLSRGFMGQTWDGFESEWDYLRWVADLGVLLRRVMLPGAILMSFGGSRTWDLLSVGLRLAGWQIYPQIAMWTYSTGSPVQYNLETAARKAVEKAKLELSKAEKSGKGDEIEKARRALAEGERLLALYEGYRSDLKPSFEPILVARNPSGGMTYLERAAIGTSAMNIDACRLAKGRYPKNVIFLHHPNCVPERGVCHADCHVRKLDEQAPHTPSGGSHGMIEKKSVRVYGNIGTSDWQSYNDAGPASRFYYCPKTAEWEKEAGLDDFPLEQHRTTIDKATLDKHGNDSGYPRRNPHPTTKPIELTTYLSKLLLPPKGIGERRLLVPCAGVGSEMIGAHLAGWDVVDGIEMTHDYAKIAEARLQWWQQFKTIESAKSAYEGARKDAAKEADGQLRMF